MVYVVHLRMRVGRKVRVYIDHSRYIDDFIRALEGNKPAPRLRIFFIIIASSSFTSDRFFSYSSFPFISCCCLENFSK